MAAKWPGQDQQTQHLHQQVTTAYQQPATNYTQQTSYQQNTGYNAAAYQQYYAQQYGTAQGYQQQAWSYGQYPQPYPQQAAWPQTHPSQQYPSSYQQQQQSQYLPQPAAQSVPTSWSGNLKGISCYNCGAKDHWAASCPQPSRSSYGYATPTAVPVPPHATPTITTPYAPQAPATRKGPVVTKYAIPAHIAAQMKARGISGASTVAPVMPGSAYGSQYPGWQQWQGQMTGQTIHQPQPGMQGSTSYIHPTQEHVPMQLPPSTTVAQAELLAPSPTETAAPQSGTVATTSQSLEGTKNLATANECPVIDQEKEKNQEEDVEDDLTSLDIPDMPKSYGTPAYVQPKLVSKPVYALAPDWTQPGYGEITICYDPNGRTESDYIKHDDAESVLNSVRTAAHDEDPIFATIDLDAPPIMDTRSESRDSGRSEFETPLTYDSVETLPTSIDETDENYVHGHRRKSGTPVYHKHKKHNEVPSRGNSRDRHQRRNRKERRGSNNFHDKKRKNKREDDRSSWPKEIEPQAKKSRIEVNPAVSQLQDS